MLTAILLSVLGFIIILVIWWYAVYFKYEVHLKQFAGPLPLPIIGNVHNIGLKGDILPSVTRLLKEYGEPLKVRLGILPRLLFADSKSVEFLLSSSTIIRKSYEYDYFHSWLGFGLLTSFGTKWRKHRKLLTPAFHFKILERFIDVFQEQSNILIKKLDKINDDEIVDIHPYITLHALDVICEATMNTSINAQVNSNSSYVRSVKNMCRILIERTLSIKMWNFVYRFSKDYQVEKDALAVLHGLSNSVIKNRSEELKSQNLNSFTEVTDWGSKKRIAFLDLLLTSNVDGHPLSHEEVREEVDTFMFEGHDTTSSGISFTLYCLSKHPEIQVKVFDEVLEILGDSKSTELTYDKLQQMKYLEQVIKESMRLYPPVPLFSRILTEDVVFQDKVIPKNVVLMLSAYNLHRNPNLFPNPEVFDPERFNFENSKNISLYSYVPFSAGPRNCIGQKFAMLEVKATVANVLQYFELLPVIEHKPVLIANAILISANGLPMRLRKRCK